MELWGCREKQVMSSAPPGKAPPGGKDRNVVKHKQRSGFCAGGLNRHHGVRCDLFPKVESWGMSTSQSDNGKKLFLAEEIKKQDNKLLGLLIVGDFQRI